MNAISRFAPSTSISSPRLAVPKASNDMINISALDDFFRARNESPSQAGSKLVAKPKNLTLSQGQSYNAVAYIPPDDNAAVELALRDSRSQFKVLVSRVSMHLGLDWLHKLFSQIDSLLDYEEWDRHDPVPSSDTARTFIRLLLILKVKRKPGLGVSNTGNLVAAWTTGPNRLTVECFPGDRVRWIVSREIDGEVERVVGDGRIERLRELLQPYEPSVWFEYAE